jgi:hypothetical protein
MNDLIHQRCFNHQRREAVARCPECDRYFCRECVTEHEDRVLCNHCLKKILKQSPFKSLPFGMLQGLLRFASGTVIAWIFFYYLGRILLSLPSSFHEGEIWSKAWW